MQQASLIMSTPTNQNSKMCEAKMDRIEWEKKDKSTITVRDFNSPHQQLMEQADRK